MPAGFAARAEALLARHWWQPRPTWLARALLPLARIYGLLLRRHQRQPVPATRLPVPVLVVGNVIAGGAGKTPTVIALVRALRAAGHRPGVVSRGHGRQGAGVHEVGDGDDARRSGDEPLLVRRRCGVPVFVGRQRAAAAAALCARHPAVDVIVADDGLQHRALPRQAELLVFDERGLGNGLLLPAGPLREPLALRLSPRLRVLHTAGPAPGTPTGALARRRFGAAWPLQAWLAGDEAASQPLHTLRDRPLLAAAGLAAPRKFFDMLAAAGLVAEPLPLPDHFDYATLPWPAATADVITTEKDAVKLQPSRLGSTRVWVVPLDLDIPDGLVADLLALLFPRAAP
ncbi:MAG: tetraacyldisaccharide 4'-kinase [Rubrivivax sp.]|nr:tetraacyldisaccharide 4'-kinase [Rubrivivax sp.]